MQSTSSKKRGQAPQTAVEYNNYSLLSNSEDFNGTQPQPLTVMKRLDDINRNMLSLQSFDGQVINAGLNTDYHFEAMLVDVEKRYGVVPAKGTAQTEQSEVSGDRDFQERVGNLSVEQRQELLARIAVHNHNLNSKRLIQYCQKQGLEVSSQKSVEPQPLINQHSGSSSYERPPQELNSEGLLREMLLRRMQGESFFTRLKGVTDSEASPEFEAIKAQYPGASMIDIAKYYDRVADFYEILAGPVSADRPLNDAKLSQVMNYFSTHRPVEQSFYVLPMQYGMFRGSDPLAKMLLLSFNEQDCLSMDMEFTQMDFRRPTGEMMALVKHQMKQYDRVHTPEGLKKFKQEAQALEAQFAERTYPTVHDWQANWDRLMSSKTAEHRVDPLAIQNITAVFNQPGSGFDVISNELTLAAAMPADIAKALGADPSLKYSAVTTIGQLAPDKKEQGVVTYLKRAVLGPQKSYHGTAIDQLRTERNHFSQKPVL